MADTEIIELESIQMKNPLFITGFTGPGLIGPTVLTYIIEQLGLEQCAYVKSTMFPPMTRIINRIPQAPIRIYKDQNKNIILIISDVFVQNEYIDKICSKIFEWIIKKDASEIISINGMAFMGVPDYGNIVFGYSTGNSQYVSKKGIHPLVDGVIIGMDSCMLNESLGSGLTWSCLLTTTTKLSGLDSSGVLKSLETVNKVFDFKVNLDKLRNELRKIRIK